jgi:hypothetical protein
MSNDRSEATLEIGMVTQLDNISQEWIEISIIISFLLG